MARLEHVNISVADGAGLAQVLEAVFGWRLRWEGRSGDGAGWSRHVGSDDDYVAIYEPGSGEVKPGQFNHLGIVVEDLEAAEVRVEALGLKAHHHADYEPGRRFYFHERNGVEIEVVSYR